MRVTVCWAGPEAQFEVLELLPEAATLQQALHAARTRLTADDARWAQRVDWDGAAVGVFGEPRDRFSVLRDGDRVEIYRPLMVDPKDGRRARARHLRGQAAPKR